MVLHTLALSSVFSTPGLLAVPRVSKSSGGGLSLQLLGPGTLEPPTSLADYTKYTHYTYITDYSEYRCIIIIDVDVHWIGGIYCTSVHSIRPR